MRGESGSVPWNYILLVFGVGALLGCRTIVVRSEAEAYFLKHPEMRRHYVRLEPTSIYMLQSNLSSRYRQARIAAQGFREIIKTNSPHLEWMEQVADAVYSDDSYPIAELKREIENSGGEIYLFETERGAVGYLIIRDGEVRLRVPFTKGIELEKRE